jgi:two-component sensor histidine kinase
MKQIEELLSGNSELAISDLNFLKRLALDWQIIADLSFADLALWVPTKSGDFIAIAHVRAATAATVFPEDFVGKVEKSLELDGSVDLFPISIQGRVIATLSVHKNPGLSRSVGRLENTYQESARQLIEMACEGTFPFTASISALNPSPRVGDGFIKLNREGEIVYASPNGRSAFSRLGWESELEALSLKDVAHKISGLPQSELQELISANSLSQISLENSGVVIELTILPLVKSGLRLGAVVLLHNVTEMRKRERELLLKDATIKEIHHRVKNNLQTVSALLRLQARRVEDEGAQSALDEAVRRISSIALVHETLSASGKDLVDFDSVVDSLISHAADLTTRTPRRSNEITVKRLGIIGSLDPKVATPLSLVITELVANAIEHGLAQSGNKVDVIFSRTGNSCEVRVEDDGVGLPENFSLKTNSNLGLQIVRTLTESELNGSLQLSRGQIGTVAQLHFEIR